MKYFDAHAHYLDRKFKRDRDELFVEMQREGVEYIVDCFGEKDMRLGLQLAKKYPFYYMCINDHRYVSDGFHGKVEKYEHLANKRVDESVERVKKLCAENKKIVGYGECHIDFRKTEKTPEGIEEQTFWLSKDLEIARRTGLVPVIHSGNADQESFDVIKNTDMPDYGAGRGMMHCYLGPPQMALDYIDMGYLISVTGLVTHRSARGKNLVEVVKQIPLKGMVIETDCPYLTPEPFRYKRNDSGLLRLTVEAIAEIKNVLPEEVAEITTANAKALFRIK